MIADKTSPVKPEYYAQRFVKAFAEMKCASHIPEKTHGQIYSVTVRNLVRSVFQQCM